MYIWQKKAMETHDTVVLDLQMAELPQSMRIAQQAIQTQEIKDIIKRLAEFNLGICMPHMHLQEGEFSELPSDMLSLEVKSDFIFIKDTDKENTLPVAWRWHNGQVITAGSCHIRHTRCGN